MSMNPPSINPGSYQHQLIFLDNQGFQLDGRRFWCSFKQLSSVQLYYTNGVFGKITAEVRTWYTKIGPPGSEVEPQVGDWIQLDGDPNQTYNIEYIVNNQNLEFIFTVSKAV